MTDLLRKIGLSSNLKIELPINQGDFVKILNSNVDKPQSDFFDIFSSSKNIYKGTVTNNGFKLRRRRKFFDMNMNWAKSSGTFRQMGDNLIIDVEVSAFHYMMIPFIIMAIIIYGIFIVQILSGEMKGNEGGWALPFVLIHATFMLGIPYFIMRRSMTSSKYEIERDIYYLMKDKVKPPN